VVQDRISRHARGDDPRRHAGRWASGYAVLSPRSSTVVNVTGLVYVAIVALWAAVLIPMWLRRHDDDQARRLDRHRSAMGTLASFSAPRSAAARAAARRRRSIVAVLAVPAVLVLGAWFLGFVPTVVAVAGVLPVVVYAPLAGAAARRGAVRAAAEQPISDDSETRRDLSDQDQVPQHGFEQDVPQRVLAKHAAVVGGQRDEEAAPGDYERPRRRARTKPAEVAEQPAANAPAARRAQPASWDEVFDQSA